MESPEGAGAPPRISASVVRAGSIGMPGPIVVEIETESTYLPLAAEGFALVISSITAA